MDTGGNSLGERIFVMDNYAKIQELVTKAKAGEDTALEALCKAVHGYDITKGNFPCHIAIAIKNNLEGLIYMGRNTDGKNYVSKLRRS